MTNKTAVVPAAIVLAILTATAQVYDGLTLYNTLNSRNTYLKDNSWQTVRSWAGTVSCSYAAYLMPDSSIWRGDVYSGASMRGAAYGGLMQRYGWDGDIVESFVWSNSHHQQHHDFQPMGNGNVLLISWDRKTAAEAQALGRQNISGDIWPDEVVEYDPAADSVVWEWHFWDHLIQDVDSTKPNYGVVREHPELLDINVGSVLGGDWIHCNTVDHSAERDEIVLTSHNLHEVFVIDHSTTTAEAAGHTGGRHGRGGDFLYRWGNPQNYDRGTAADRVFYIAHGANWVRPGMPGAGNIIVLNNGDRSGSAGDSSVIVEIAPPLDSNDHYYTHLDSAFGPRTTSWQYSNGRSFYSQHLGGAYRLPNGNTLAVLGTSGAFREVSPDGQVVWTASSGGQLGHPMKYARDFTAVSEGAGAPVRLCRLEAGAPNPFVRSCRVRYSLSGPSRVRVFVRDAVGRVVAALVDGTQLTGTYSLSFAPANDLPAGVYLLCFEATPVDSRTGGRYAATQRLVKGR